MNRKIGIKEAEVSVTKNKCPWRPQKWQTKWTEEIPVGNTRALQQQGEGEP